VGEAGCGTSHARLVAAAAVLRWSTHAMVTLQLVGKVKAPFATALMAVQLRYQACSCNPKSVDGSLAVLRFVLAAD
jgi:hypothetical protein